MIDFIQAPATLPAGQRVYVVGDVHGCLDRLEALHSLIAADFAARPARQPLLIHLGDYVDRGRDSAGVVARLAAGASVPGMTAINLMGNHEHMMLAALEPSDTEATELWLANGGGDSLRSWGVPSSAQAEHWSSYLPRDHVAFLRELTMQYSVGGYVFVHAGIRPGVPLEQQTSHDLMWIREPFLSSTDRFPAVVVHGHTPRPEPVVRANRVGIDTGAVMGGALTCAVLESDKLGFITA